MEDLKTTNLLDLNQTITSKFLHNYTYPFEALREIKNYIKELIPNLDANIYIIKKDIAIAKSAIISNKAEIVGPTIIGENTEIRPFSYIRGNVIIGNNCVVGNSSEIKNSIIFNNAQIPHFNYVGDSILGYKAHIGAGVKISNLKSDKSNITIKYNNEKIETNLRKMGAIIGDYVEVGCNTVLNPGTIIGKNSTIYPVCSIKGFVKENVIYKNNNVIINKN